MSWSGRDSYFRSGIAKTTANPSVTWSVMKKAEITFVAKPEQRGGHGRQQ